MLIASGNTINVGMGEVSVIQDEPTVLTCIGLGSCIACCIYDPVTHTAGLAHMLLPCCRSNDAACAPVKYINTGIPLLIKKMMKKGSEKGNLIVKITGGAKMLSIPGENNILDVGQRNINEVKAALGRENLSICGADLGGSFGRTVQFFADTGRVFVKAVNGRTIEL